ncbi:hypothetical protein [Marinoscillum sp. MHG1-6]|uniref:hypothetical protein n=1 Tax=Marinoscillum sp. MHG1-6 TaxID=2959627 RepID=UPI0021588BE6|nr:hypothetical protein [Marinoscillum sp. MHG1-6]
MKVLILLIGVFASFTSSAQISDETCNRQTRDGFQFMVNRLPENLCLPREMVLFGTHPLTDINDDGRNDIVIQIIKSGFSDGDTLFTVVYFMNRDSSYSMIKRLSKLDVLYYKSYSADYFKDMREATGNQYIYNILAGKHGNPPNNETTFDGDKIKISMEPAVGLKYRFEYTYDVEIQNWRQTKFIIVDEELDPQIQSIEIEEPAPLITEFDITDYM